MKVDIEQELRSVPDLGVHVSREYIRSEIHRRRNSTKNSRWRRLSVTAACVAGIAGISTAVAKNYIIPDFHQNVTILDVPPSDSGKPEGAAISPPQRHNTEATNDVLDTYAAAKDYVGSEFPVPNHQPIGQYLVFKWNRDDFAIQYGLQGRDFNIINVWHGEDGLPRLVVPQVSSGKPVYSSEDALDLGGVNADVWHITCDDWNSGEWTYITWKRGDWTMMVESTMPEDAVNSLAKQLDQSAKNIEGNVHA